MAWGALQTATQLTSITTIQYFDDVITLNPGETAHIQVDVNPQATPTDHALVEVFTTLDDSSENWDDTPIFAILIDKGTDPNSASFTVSDLYKFRVGVRRNGSTDTITSADMKHRVNGISV